MKQVTNPATDLRLSIAQITKRIVLNGKRKTYAVRGGMGIGKSSILKAMQAILGDEYEYVMVDCTQIVEGDVTIPAIDMQAQIFRQLPNVMFVGENGKPVVVCLDELAKAGDAVKDILSPIALERRVGLRPMHKQSYVFATMNLGEELVGDKMKSHTRQRYTFLEARNPTAEEWIENFGIPNNLHPALLRWVQENPAVFHSFKDVADPADNPYIFHPKAARDSFVTPRSMFLANMELADEEGNPYPIDDYQATVASLAGCIGTRAAFDLMAAVELGEKMPLWGAIMADPTGCDLPADNPAILMMSLFRCVSRVEEHTLPLVMAYIKRFPKELQAVFASRLMATPSKSRFAVLSAEVKAWFTKNNWMMNKHAI